MAAAGAALIPPTADAALEAELRSRLKLRGEPDGSIGELEPLALRLGLVQRTAQPRIDSPRIVVFAADHGLAVEQVGAGDSRSTVATVLALLAERLPLAAFARVQGLELSVVDSGCAQPLAAHPRLLARKIAHGTRNARAAAAMSTAQAHAAMRAGMEIGDTLGGSVVVCAGIGDASAQSAALLLSCLSDAPLRDFVDTGDGAPEGLFEHRLRVLQDARNRHGHLEDPVEILAAVGGFEVAMMAGSMLVAANRRRLIVTDGMAACAALAVAAAIAPSITDYCVHARSKPHPCLDRTWALLGQRSLSGVAIDSLDGTGATLAWPLLRAAVALLGAADDAAPQAARSAAATFQAGAQSRP